MEMTVEMAVTGFYFLQLLAGSSFPLFRPYAAVVAENRDAVPVSGLPLAVADAVPSLDRVHLDGSG